MPQPLLFTEPLRICWRTLGPKPLPLCYGLEHAHRTCGLCTRGHTECSNKDPMTIGSQHFIWTPHKSSPLARARASGTIRWGPVESSKVIIRCNIISLADIIGAPGYQQCLDIGQAELACCCSGLCHSVGMTLGNL